MRSILVFAAAVASGCAGMQAMQWRPQPKPTCEVVYEEPQRDIKRCITRRQMEEMLRVLQ